MGSYSPHVGAKQTLRASTVALATTFDTSPTAVRCQGWNQAVLLCTVANFAATSVDIEVDFATPDQNPNGSEGTPVTADWYTRTWQDGSSATASTVTMLVPVRKWQGQLVGNGTFEIPIPIMAHYMRVRAKTTGGPGATTLEVKALQGMA